jgi:hypothetical protein
VCGVTYQNPDEHNPFTCRDKNDGFNRSEAERQWLLDFSALTRAWRARAPHQELQPTVPNVRLLDAGNGNAVPITRVSTQHRDITNHVRLDEQRARKAGVIHLGSDTQDRRDAREDAALESAHSSDAYTTSVSSSSWVPTTSESSLSSYQTHHREFKILQQTVATQSAQMERQRQEFQDALSRMQEQHLQAIQQMQTQQQTAQPSPMFMPPLMPPYGFIPNGPMTPNMIFPMANPIYPGISDQPQQYHAAHTRRVPIHALNEDPFLGDAQPHAAPHWQSMIPPGDLAHERIQFQPAANHVEHAGMAGAPELAPDQLGKIAEFQKHVKTYNAYAMKAVSKGETHLSLAQTMAKHAFSMATSFTSQLMKRYRLAPHTFKPGDILEYTPRMVLAMSDDLFTRLYTESCSITIEDPSQVYSILSKLEYVRQTPEEDGPLPALMRAEAAFRAKLSLLPQHAVSRCRHQELRDAFIKMVFTEAKFEMMKLDFQQCATWENVYQQLTYRAGTASAWYTEAPRHKTTPEVSVSNTVSSSSPARDKPEDKNSEAGKQASAAYWKDQLARLQKTMRYDPAILEDAHTDKRKAKILQKLRYRQTLEAEIRNQVSKAFHEGQLRSGETREQSRERGGRSGSFRHDRSHRQEDFRPSREQSQERHYERRHDRPRDDRGRSDDRNRQTDRPTLRAETAQREQEHAGGGTRQHDTRDQHQRSKTPPPSDTRQVPTIPSPSRSSNHSTGRPHDNRTSRSPSSDRSR